MVGTNVGSSPRGRGTPSGTASDPGYGRFIPAWAGNAVAFLISGMIAAVHPRVGGERLHQEAAGNTGAGSSPRGRGTRYPPRDRCQQPRFIPAWAGNARARTTHLFFLTVHPRVGGERLYVVRRII